MPPAKNPVRTQRVAAILLLLLLLVVFVLAAFVCVKALLARMDDAIQDSGKASMSAVVEQLQQNYELQVANYYSRLRIIESYTDQDDADLLASESFTRLVDTLQDETGWQVFFLKDNGTAMTVDGTERRLDIPSDLLGDLKAGQEVAKLISYNDGQQARSKFLLAIPCDAYEFGGQTFTAIGALVDRAEIDAALKMSAYSGEAFLFMVGNDGEVFYTNQSDGKLFQNYALLKHLVKDDALTDEQAASLQAAFDAHETGVGLYGGERGYYLGYAPIEGSSCTIVCIVSQGFVESSLGTYQKTVLHSTLAMAAALLLLMAGLFLSLSKVSVARQKAELGRESLKQQEQSLRRLEALNAELGAAQAVTAQALQAAEAASRAKTDFLANMSHDIRTPMNAVVGLASLIEHDAADEARVREYARRMQASSQNLLGIINEVLDMNKIESGTTTLNCADFSILELARNVEDMFRPQAEARRQTFEVAVGDIRHEWLCGDEVRLTQIFSNLLSNAVKYTQPGGSVRFSVEELPASSASHARFRFLVRDNGMGIDADFQDKIFDAFTREESTLTNKIQGTGLGMAITKSLVELMGGTISVTSEKGHGSCFEVLLDMKACDKAGAAAAGQQGPGEGQDAVSLKGMRILCAEDNAINAEILAELLGMEGASCTVCENGRDAVEAFERSAPGAYDLILMDVQMPVMNGYEATRAIRASSHEGAARIPILAMTANAFSEDVQACLSAGMDAHVSKPIDMAVLKKAVASVLAERRR